MSVIGINDHSRDELYYSFYMQSILPSCALRVKYINNVYIYCVYIIIYIWDFSRGALDVMNEQDLNSFIFPVDRYIYSLHPSNHSSRVACQLRSYDYSQSHDTSFLPTEMAPPTPSQPPKESSYTQPDNPISHNPQETEKSRRHYGDPVPTIVASAKRTADSRPSTDESLRRQQQDRTRHQQHMQSAPDVDTEYGVEQQPAEGDIAAAVKGKSERAQNRMQAGAHAGPVGSAEGPGAPQGGKAGEATGTVTMMSELDRKTEEHEQVLGERVGRSPPAPEPEGTARQVSGVEEENAALRREKLKQDREVDVTGAVGGATGGKVVGAGKE